MPFIVNVMPAHVREQMIASAVAATEKREAFHAYQNREHQLPVIMVPLGLPIYRMANYRTRIAQQSYLRREGKPASFFSAGQENDEAQQLQNELLVKFAEEGRKGSITPIVEVLEVEGQHDPILITSSGVVVNGNRRLAAMRDLYDKDSNVHRSFSHVKCLVLSSTITESEIVEIEIRLQMKQRTELAYGWINECIAIKELRDSGKSIRDLMGMMNKKKSEVESSINALIEADLYLSDWKSSPGNYESVEDAEQLFYDIASNVTSKSGEIQEISRRIAWTFVDRRSGLRRRVYDFNPMFGKKADEVASKLADKIGVEVQNDAESDEGEDFDVVMEENIATSSLRPLIAAFDDPARREEIANELVEICENIIELDKGERDGLLPLNLVQKANGFLAAADLTRAAPESLLSIGKQLEQIQVQVTRMLAFVAGGPAGSRAK